MLPAQQPDGPDNILDDPALSDSTSSFADDNDDSHSDISSPAPSIFSLTDSAIARSYRLLHGRKCNSNSNVYTLPADSEELIRLRSQHYLFESVVGRYPPGFEDRMRPEQGIVKRAMDIGCGCGAWIMQLANDFPECEAVGIDLVPMNAHDMPENCRSEVDDVNLGLEHYYSKFDVVHARLIASGITDYLGLIEHVSRVLRPLGMVEFAEWDFCIYDQNKVPLNGDSTDPCTSRVAKFCRAIADAARSKGGDLDAASQIKRWCQENNRFEPLSIQETDYWVPASPWSTEISAEGDKLRSWGDCMKEDCLSFTTAVIPLLMSTGWEKDDADFLIQEAQDELNENMMPLYVRWQVVTAQRRIY